ncbi:MAG: hypothetical protein ACNS62_08870 [Candidatus Cyclobacteriaceae bacterium M3_2C_046]
MDKFFKSDTTDEERIHLARNNGTFLTMRVESNSLIELYAVGNFFVEIWYNQDHFEEKISVVAFKGTKYLDVYLNQDRCFALLKKVSVSF